MKKVKKLFILVLSIFIGMSLFIGCPGSPNSGNNGNGSGEDQNQNTNPGTDQGTNDDTNQGSDVNYDDTDGDIIITFKSNTDDEQTVTQKIKSNTIKALRPNSFTKADYDFVGWTLSAETRQSHIKYFDESQVKLSASITLYANWIEKSESNNKLKFYMNYEGASDEPYVLNFYGSAKFIYPECPVIREGYHILGWSSNKENIIPKFAKNEEENSTGSRYAIWAKDNTLAVFYKKTPNSAKASEVVRIDYEEKDSEGYYTLSLPDSKFDRDADNKKFTYWIPSPNDGSGPYYYTDLFKTNEEYACFYSEWIDTDTASTINLYRNFSDDDEEKIVIYIKQFWQKKGCPFTRDNYTFKEWNSKRDGTGKIYKTTSENSHKYGQSYDYYAIWEEK